MFKYWFHFLVLLFFVVVVGCKAGDIGSSTSTSSVDNSVDNSQHGISSCATGSTLVCRKREDGGGAEAFTQTIECVNVNGEPVVLTELEPVDDDINEACPEGEAVILEEGEFTPGIDQGFP